MTRPYRLGKRADIQAATRARIVAAALELYREGGMAGTSMLAVAKTADVAPGTVRNHFADPAALATAVGSSVLEHLGLPDAGIFDGLGSMRARVDRLGRELAALSDRGEGWWFTMQREPELAAVWRPLETAYAARLETLLRAALGPLRDDDRALAVLAAAIGPPMFYALKGRGLTSTEAVDVGVDLVVPWLERRQRDRPRASSRPKAP